MDANNSYFKKKFKKIHKDLYKAIGLLLVVVIISILITVLSGSYRILLVEFFVCIFGLVMYRFIFNPNKINKLLSDGFQSSTPDLLVNAFEKMTIEGELSQDLEISMTYNKALVLSFYGQFDKAAIEMEKIDWEQMIPIYQSMKLSFEILRSFLEPSDDSERLVQIYKMRELESISPEYYAGKEHFDLVELYIEMDELLKGNIQDKFLKSLESKFTKAPFFIKLVIAWALGYSYNKIGSTYLAQSKIDYCKAVAPYCYVLHRLD